MGLISDGTTIFDAGALDSGIAKGAMTFIKKLTASSSATLSFVNGGSSVVLDSTYKEYIFTYNNIHPATNSVVLQFNLSIDSGSNYNVTKTSSSFNAYHPEDNSGQGLAYTTYLDLAEGTGFQDISSSVGYGNDQGVSGTLHLFNPSSTTFVKHYISKSSTAQVQPAAYEVDIGGYANTTSAVNAVQFKFNSGNIDAGDICLYGIS